MTLDIHNIHLIYIRFYYNISNIKRKRERKLLEIRLPMKFCQPISIKLIVFVCEYDILYYISVIK